MLSPAVTIVLQGINTEHILKTRGLTKHFTISGLLVSSRGVDGARLDGRSAARRSVDTDHGCRVASPADLQL